VGSYLAHGSKNYPKAHENLRAFSYISAPIFLESSVQCLWGVRLHQHNLWVECEGHRKNLKFLSDTFEQYEILQKQPQDVVTLHQKIYFLRQTLSKFVGSTKKLNKMLRYNKCPTNKFGNGYKGKKNIHDEEIIVCYLCGKVGHMSSNCRHLPTIGSSNAFRTN